MIMVSSMYVNTFGVGGAARSNKRAKQIVILLRSGDASPTSVSYSMQSWQYRVLPYDRVITCDEVVDKTRTVLLYALSFGKP